MRKGGGHSKGASFERDIAKRIVKAFTKFGIKQSDCWRSVLSGGHEMSSGDLRMSAKMEKLFPFSVECKAHKKVEWWRFNVEHEFRKPSWKEIQWLQQASDGAKKGKGLQPLLVIKENNRPILVMKRDREDGGWNTYLWDDFIKGELLLAAGRK